MNAIAFVDKYRIRIISKVFGSDKFNRRETWDMTSMIAILDTWGFIVVCMAFSLLSPWFNVVTIQVNTEKRSVLLLYIYMYTHTPCFVVSAHEIFQENLIFQFGQKERDRHRNKCPIGSTCGVTLSHICHQIKRYKLIDHRDICIYYNMYY